MAGQETEQVPLDGCLLIAQGSLGGQSLSAPAGYDGPLLAPRSSHPVQLWGCLSFLAP